MIPAVVIAAGRGSRLEPLTTRYAKPVLPVAGRPVLATLLRELAAAGVPRATVVVGRHGEQVERLVGDGSAFGLPVRIARQESPDGSAHAVAAAEPDAPYLVVGADQVFAPGDVARFVSAFAAGGVDGAVAVQDAPGTVETADGAVIRLLGSGRRAAPLWAVGGEVAPYVAALPGAAPYELATAFERAIAAGKRVAGIEIGPTQDLTTPLDLLELNFPYLRGL